MEAYDVVTPSGRSRRGLDERQVRERDHPVDDARGEVNSVAGGHGGLVQISDAAVLEDADAGDDVHRLGLRDVELSAQRVALAHVDNLADIAV